MSNFITVTRFWNSLYQVRTNPNYLKAKLSIVSPFKMMVGE